MKLPEGLSARPLTMDDARAAYAVLAADEYAQLGKCQVELEDVVAGWQRPSFDLARSTMGAFEGDELVGFAEHSGGDRSEVVILPRFDPGPLHAELTAWMEETARVAGVQTVSMTVPAGGSTDRALAELGYRERWTTWVLLLPNDALLPERALPDGYSLRTATEADYPVVHEVISDAFHEWSTRERPSLEDFLAETVGRPGFEPWMLRVVTDASSALVAACYLVFSGGEAFVSRLAARADHRRRGLAQILLADAFRSGREHGASTCSLSTDSRTGARGLYEKVGMVVVDTWVNRGKDL